MTIIITFFVSLVGITLLIAFKVWEVSANAPKLVRVRTRADIFLAKKSASLRTHASEKGSVALKNIFRGFLKSARLTAYNVTRILDRRFAFITATIRGQGTIRRDGTVSVFLRNVAEHKKHVSRENSPL